MIRGTRDRSGTGLRTVFSATIETGSLLCKELAAVVPTEDVMRDDTLGEPVLVDVVAGLAVLGLLRRLRTDGGLAFNGLGVVDVAFNDSIRCR